MEKEMLGDNKDNGKLSEYIIAKLLEEMKENKEFF
jgi:hypothetical protein